jgi:hypothetical protein
MTVEFKQHGSVDRVRKWSDVTERGVGTTSAFPASAEGSPVPYGITLHTESECLKASSCRDRRLSRVGLKTTKIKKDKAGKVGFFVFFEKTPSVES